MKNNFNNKILIKLNFSKIVIFFNEKLLALLFVINLFSLNKNTYKHLGVIKLDDSAFISSKLDFEELDGIVNGYSIVDMGAHETKFKLVSKKVEVHLYKNKLLL